MGRESQPLTALCLPMAGSVPVYFQAPDWENAVANVYRYMDTPYQPDPPRMAGPSHHKCMLSSQGWDDSEDQVLRMLVAYAMEKLNEACPPDSPVPDECITAAIEITDKINMLNGETPSGVNATYESQNVVKVDSGDMLFNLKTVSNEGLSKFVVHEMENRSSLFLINECSVFHLLGLHQPVAALCMWCGGKTGCCVDYDAYEARDVYNMRQ